MTGNTGARFARATAIALVLVGALVSASPGRAAADPPETSITDGPGAYSSNTNQTVRFTSDHTRARFECSLDRAAFAPCTSPLGLVGLTDGVHDLFVRAVDGVADASPASLRWIVDTVVPTVQITSPVSGWVYIGQTYLNMHSRTRATLIHPGAFRLDARTRGGSSPIAITYFANGTPICTSAPGATSCTWLPSTGGTTLSAIATSAASLHSPASSMDVLVVR